MSGRIPDIAGTISGYRRGRISGQINMQLSLYKQKISLTEKRKCAIFYNYYVQLTSNYEFVKRVKMCRGHTGYPVSGFLD